MSNLKLSIKDNSKNYTCTVVQIDNLHNIEGADRIKRTVVLGNNVIVGLDTKIGQKMLYFNSGTKLNEEYCKYNNLYDKAELNADPTKKGYIGSKSRVSAVKLKGIISDGILMPIGSLLNVTTALNLQPDSLQIGDSFTDIGDFSLCEKYFVPSRNSNPGGKAPKQPKRISRLIDNQFLFHNDTENLRRNIHKLNPNDIIGIHYKKHGTSVIISNVLVKKQLKWYERVLKRIGVPIVDTQYDIVYSSRKVIKNEYLNPDQKEGFYGEDIWGIVAKEIGHLIPKGWQIYGEIIGYLPSGNFIQKSYDYGCAVGEHKFYVYKIGIVNVDGKTIYLTDLQIKEWCDKVGLLYSDTLKYYGRAIDRYNYNIGGKWSIEEWRDRFLSVLEATYNEHDCYICKNKVPEEGIVLRIEHLDSYEAYKLKSKAFILQESNDQEKEVTNLEDQN
jgi:hypothetical protein